MQDRMDWRSLRFDWNHAKAFLATAELGSLARAAEALDLSQPTLSRHVEAMQQSFGVVLFERVGRGLVLTRAGLELLEHVRAMGVAAWGANTAAQGRTECLTGMVVVAVSDVYATTVLPKIVADITRQHRGLSVEIVVENGRNDLRRREADIAVRSYETEHPDLITKKLGWDLAGFYASHEWVECNGAPATHADMGDLPFIGYPGQSWMLKGLVAQGFRLSEDKLRIVSDSHLAQWAHVRAGAGVGVMTLRVGDTDPEVTRLLPHMDPLRFPVWLASHRDLRTSLRVKTVFDMLSAGIALSLKASRERRTTSKEV